MSSSVLNSNPATRQHHHLERLKYWSVISAYGLAAAEGIRLTQEHIDILFWLRNQFDLSGSIEPQQTLLQLITMYQTEGGVDYLLCLFPKDIIGQSMRIAGLPTPMESSEHISIAS